MKWIPQAALGLTAFAGAFGLFGTDLASRAAAPEGGEVITIEIDVADLPDTRSEIAPVVEAELQRLLAVQGELPPGVIVAEDRRLLVELRPGPIPGADDVLIRVEARHEGQVLGETATETCLSCTNEQVAQKALPMLRPLLDRFPAPKRAPAPAVDPPREADTGAELEPGPARPNQAMLISGVSLLGVGLAGLGTGITLIIVDERVVSEPGAAQLEVIKYRDPGIGVTVVGAVAAATGATLLGLAFRRRGRAALDAGLLLTPENYGLSLSGSF
jgi:hypothetical protein